MNTAQGPSVANCTIYITATLMQPAGNGKIITQVALNTDLNADRYDRKDFAYEVLRIIAQLGLEGWELIYERFDVGGPSDPEEYYFFAIEYYFKRPKPPE